MYATRFYNSQRRTISAPGWNGGKAYPVSGIRKSGRVRSFWSGRSTYNRMTNNVGRASNRLIRATYSAPEKKFKDTVVETSVRDTGAIALLNGLTQGTTVLTRIGNQILIKKIHLKFYIEGALFAQTPTIAMGVVRILLLWDKQPNGALPALSDILQSTTNTTSITSSMDLDTVQRFNVLWDKRFTYANQVTNVPFSEGNQYHEYFVRTNLKTTYAAASAGDITDIRTGALLLVYVSDSAAAANDPVVSGYVRIRYTDN